jgi:HEAT repeat protein
MSLATPQASGHWAWLERGSVSFFLAACILLAACRHEDRKSSVVQLDVQQTVRELGSDDLQVASAAESRLSAIGLPALPALAAALRQEPETVRLGVIEVLADMEGDDVSAVLVDALDDPSAQVRAEAAMALRAHPQPPVDRALGRTLDDPDAIVRQRSAIACSSSCRSAESMRALVRHALEDPEPLAASTAAASLTVLYSSKDPALVQTVKAAVEAAVPAQLQHTDAQRRERAAIVLAGIQDIRAVPVLEQMAAASNNPRLRLRAIYALGQIGDASAVPVLKARLADNATAVYAHDALRRAATRNVPGASEALAGYAGPHSPVPLRPPT